MFSNRHITVFSALLACTIELFTANTANAGGFTQLPRNLGPFKLGMPEATFAKGTAVQPNVCPMCIDGESFASLSAAAIHRLIPKFPVGSGIDFFFYNKKLYHIALGPKENDLFTVKQDFETRFGAGTQSNAISGNSIVQWEDKVTTITLNFNKSSNEVFSINYYDWKQKQSRDQSESKLLDTINADRGTDKKFSNDLIDLPPLPVATQ